MATSAQSTSRFAIDRRLLSPKAFYFCFYAAGAALIPFLGLYYASIGLTGRTIGLLAGLPPLITLVAAPLWGGLADATNRHKQLLLAAIGGVIVVALSISMVTQLLWLLPLVAVYAFFSAPIVPLVDNTVLAMLGPLRNQYGKQRIWGAIGWGVSAAIMGIVIQRTDLRSAFYGYALFMGLGWIVAGRLPVVAAGIGSKFWNGLSTMMRRREWVIFLLAVFTSSIAGGMYNNFLFLYLDSMGAAKTLMGFSLVVATFSELPIFFYSDRLLARWGARGVLIFAMATLIVRMFAYAAMPAAWWVLPIHLLHGITFSAMWVAGVANADALAPEGLGATAQGMFSAVTFGIGAATGALLGGLLYEDLGAIPMFRTAGVIVALGLVFYLVMGKPEGDKVTG